jgi:hypothetical protein
MKTIETEVEFQVGDEIWTIEECVTGTWIDCPACKGERTRIIDGYPFNCNTCLEGRIWEKTGVKLNIEKIFVVGVNIDMEKDRTEIRYTANKDNMPSYGLYFRSGKENIYSSKQKAEDAVRDKHK